MTAVDPTPTRPRAHKRTALYGVVHQRDGMVRYLTIRRVMGLDHAYERLRRSTDIMDRFEWVDVDPESIPADCAIAQDPDARIDGIRFTGALDTLSERLRYVLRQRVLGDTLGEVGAALGLSKERVRRLEREAVWRTRERVGLSARQVRHDDDFLTLWMEQSRAWCARWAAGG